MPIAFGSQCAFCNLWIFAIGYPRSRTRSVAVLSGENNLSQSPHDFSALSRLTGRLYYLTRPTKTAMLRRLPTLLKSYLFCSILESAAVRSEMEVSFYVFFAGS